MGLVCLIAIADYIIRETKNLRALYLVYYFIILLSQIISFFINSSIKRDVYTYSRSIS